MGAQKSLMQGHCDCQRFISNEGYDFEQCFSNFNESPGGAC